MSAKRIAKYNKLLVSAIGAIVLLVKEIGFDIDNQAINSTINSIGHLEKPVYKPLI